MAEREHRDPSQEALQKQKKKGRAVWLGLAVAAAVVVLHLWKRNNLLSIFGGTALYMVLVQAVFV